MGLPPSQWSRPDCSSLSISLPWSHLLAFAAWVPLLGTNSRHLGVYFIRHEARTVGTSQRISHESYGSRRAQVLEPVPQAGPDLRLSGAGKLQALRCDSWLAGRQCPECPFWHASSCIGPQGIFSQSLVAAVAICSIYTPPPYYLITQSPGCCGEGVLQMWLKLQDSWH